MTYVGIVKTRNIISLDVYDRTELALKNRKKAVRDTIAKIMLRMREGWMTAKFGKIMESKERKERLG